MHGLGALAGCRVRRMNPHPSPDRRAAFWGGQLPFCTALPAGRCLGQSLEVGEELRSCFCHWRNHLIAVSGVQKAPEKTMLSERFLMSLFMVKVKERVSPLIAASRCPPGPRS